MHVQGNGDGRYLGGASNAYSPNMERPGRKSGGGRRTALKVVLCVLLPPVGLVWIWRTASFATRGRVLASVLAFASMLVMCLPLFPGRQATPVTPQAAAPVAATHAPEEDVVTALSNIEEVLLQQEAAEAAQRGEATPSPEPTEEPAMTNEEIYDTIVYSVYNNAVYYHATSMCNGQENRRQLTVRQAQSLGLGACPNCNPPVPVTTAAPAAE